MKISGKYTLDATRDEVWEALNDIHVLARVVPGCERLDQTADNEYEGMVKIGIQAIKGSYSGRIRMEDIQAPSHLTLVANGKSANGVVDGTGTVDLEEKDGKTLLTYSGDAQIGGVLASVGQRLIEGASRQLINQSLKALAEQIALRRQSASNGTADSSPTAPPQPASVTQLATPAPLPAQNNAPTSEAVAAATADDIPVSAPLFPNAEATPITAAVPPGPRRSVVVPEHEQLKPESIISGMLNDIHNERPWLIWVALAAVIGYLLGRARDQ